jgi:DNA polymerase-1
MPTTLFAPGSDDVMVIVDLSAHLFRAYHAIRPLSSPTGEPTHAVYGVVAMLERLVKDVRPKRLAIALDSGRATFRAQIYPEYKANRPTPPEDLIVQLRRASEVVRAFTPHVWQKEGYEADDLIATAVSRARVLGLKSLVVGADKDLMQLCCDDVRLWDTMRDKVIGPPEVAEKFGVSVEQLGDLLALMGDSSDNIPGVPGIGPKTAAELLVQFGSLDGIYASVGNVAKKRVRELLIEHEGLARLSRQLVELHCDCDPDIDPAQTLWTGRDAPRLHSLYTELGFTRFAAGLGISKTVPTPVLGTPEVGLAVTDAPSGLGGSSEHSPIEASANRPLQTAAQRIEKLEELRDRLASASTAEPWTLSLLRADETKTHSPPVVLALGFPDATTVVVPISSLEVSRAGVALHHLGPLLATHFARPEVKLQTHRARSQWLTLLGLSMKTANLSFDTELASYLLDPESPHDIESLAQRYLDEKRSSPVSNAPRKRTTKPVDADELHATELRAIREATLVRRLAPELTRRMGDEGLDALFFDIELPLARVLANMQLRGVLVDTSKLSEMSQAMDAEMARLEAEAIRLAGHPFNVNAPRQLETILFDELSLKPIRRTKTSRSTDAATLEALADEHPLPRLILAHRQVAKLKSTYVDALPNLVDPKTGRVHSSWEQTIAATGRLSSTDPNLQNIPIRTSLGRSIRKAFVAPTGTKLVSADYSQIELRVLAHLAQDPELLSAYEKGEDVHLRTAAAVFGVAESEVTDEMRRQAKAVNFGVIYGQGESGLASALGIPRHQAGEFIAAYYRKYVGVRRFMNETLEHARHGKAVRSLLGRRRLFNEIDNANRSVRLAAERMAMNMPIQATAADLLKLAMLKLDEPVTPGARMIMSVHDELVFEVPDAEVEQAKKKISEVMQHVMSLSVPLEVDVGSAANWADAH